MNRQSLLIACLVALGLIAAALFLNPPLRRTESQRAYQETSPSSTPLASLNEEERSWLRQHNLIRVAQDPGWPPVEFADAHGDASGMSNDYLALVEARLGTTFERTSGLSWQESYARLKRYEIDITTCVAITPERMDFWVFTKPYIKIPIVILARSDVTYISSMNELAGRKVAAVDGYVAGERIPRDFPEIQLVKVETVKDGIDRLQRGEVFALIDNMLVISYHLTKQRIYNLKIAGETPYVNAQCMAVRKDWPILAEILQKALDSISEEQRGQIYAKWVPIRYEHGIDYSLVQRILAIVATGFLVLLVWNYQLSGEIRRRKHVEEALRRSDALLRRTQAVSRVGGWECDALSGRVTWTDETYLIHEVSHDYDPTSMETNFEFYLPEDRARIVSAFRNALEKGDPFDLELELVTAQRRGIWVRTAGQVDQEDGRVIRVVGNILDITERKHAEAERNRLMAAIEQAGEIVVVTSPDGTIQYVNPAFTTVTGYTRDEIVGRNPRTLKSGQHDAAFYADLWKRISEGRPWRGWMSDKRKSGALCTLATTITPVCNTDGQIVSYVAVQRDITERLSLEEQLRASQKMEAIGRLAGGVAHDFNNLLSVILSYTRFAMDGASEIPALQKDLQEVQKAGESAAKLTKQLLAFSRKQVLETRILNLNRIIRHLENILGRMIGQDIELELRLASDLGSIRADPGQLEQVITNLVINARDAMTHGGRLTVETENVDLDDVYAARHLEVTAGQHILLKITDTGCGMDQTTQQRLFEPFFTTKEPGKGTGLGLSTVYGIVKQSGGHICVHSELGRGTTFQVYLPRFIEDPVSPSTEIECPALTAGSEVILLVEDEEAVRKCTTRILQAAGYIVIPAARGAEAQQWCAQHDEKIHLLLTDVVMPKMDGHQLAEELLLTRPDLRVLYMSGHTDNAIVHDGILLPGTNLLSKPFTQAELRQKVREALEQVQPGLGGSPTRARK